MGMARWCSALWPHSVPFLLLKTTGIGSSNQNKEQSWRTTGHQQMLVIHCFGCGWPAARAKPAASFYVWSWPIDLMHFLVFLLVFSLCSVLLRGFTVITHHSIGCDGKMMCYGKNEALFTPQSVSWPKPSLAKSWTPVEKHWTAPWR